MRDPIRLMRRIGIGQWVQWKAWFKLQGPPGSLGDDLRAAGIALAAAQAGIAENDRLLKNFLPAGRTPSDYAGWLDFGEDAEPEPVTYFVE